MGYLINNFLKKNFIFLKKSFISINNYENF